MVAKWQKEERKETRAFAIVRTLASSRDSIRSRLSTFNIQRESRAPDLFPPLSTVTPQANARFPRAEILSESAEILQFFVDLEGM